MDPHRLYSQSSRSKGVHKVDLSNIPDPQSLSIRLGIQMVMISPRPLVEAWRRSRPEGALEHVQAVLPTSGPSCHTGSHVHVPSPVHSPFVSGQAGRLCCPGTLRIILVMLSWAKRPRHAPVAPLLPTNHTVFSIGHQRQHIHFWYRSGILKIPLASSHFPIAGQNYHTQAHAPHCICCLWQDCRLPR